MAASETVTIRNTNTVFSFPEYATRAQWEARREHLRRRILVSAGLWPLPDRCPLHPRVTGRADHDGYSIENVYFESYPGFFVTGNLYRPLGRPGPFPGVLCPHGHWQHGRLEDQELGSIPGRCINFALQGYVAFAYDMVGYNDSGLQVPHTTRDDERASFWDEPRFYLWGVSLLGLQLWNGIRSIDFLMTLPDVDPQRIGCTGASGGGTQTFMLTAVDERVQVAAPVNMISAHMQGGCVCENAPGLRLDTYNVEIGAMAAPRPLIMVSATGDWTKNTPTVEYPAVRSIYRLYGAEERIDQHQVDADHNYNRESREAVYAWFGKWLLGESDAAKLRERPFVVDPPDTMRVFPDGKLPAHAASAGRLVSDLIAARAAQIESLRPTDAASLQAYREIMGTAYRYALNASLPAAGDLVVERGGEATGNGCSLVQLRIRAAGEATHVPALLLAPERPRGAVLLVDAAGKKVLVDGDRPSELARAFLAGGYSVVGIDVRGTGEADKLPEPTVPHFLTFNLGPAALRIQDILTTVAYLRGHYHTVHLAGTSEAGLWCLLARAMAPAVATTIVDAAHFDCGSDEAWAQQLYVPHIRRAGDLKTAAALVAPSRLQVYNAAASFPSEWFRRVYEVAGAADALRIEPDMPTLSEVVASL